MRVIFNRQYIERRYLYLYFSPQPFRSDKPALLRNEGVFTVKKWPIKKLTDLEILDKTIIAEIKIKRKKFFFVLSYRHPNQTLDEVNLYMQNLENIYEIINKENHAASIICGNYNATSTLVWETEIKGRLHI